jgi:hypothetical protein
VEGKCVGEEEAECHNSKDSNWETVSFSEYFKSPSRIIWVSHLSKNTQRHVVSSAIAPPIIGPKRVARATSIERMEPYLGYFSGGISSKKTIIEIEKHPAPPRPCRARKTILKAIVSCDV